LFDHLIIDSDKTLGEVFNIGNSEEISIQHLAEKVISTLNSSSVIARKEYEAAYGAGFEDMQRRVPNISKIESTLGWRPTRSLETIIVDIARSLGEG